MKKLFSLAVSALLIFGLAACNSSEKKEEEKKEDTPAEKKVEDFSDEIIKDGNEVYGMTGPNTAYIDGTKISKAWGDADGSLGLAKAVSLRDVAKKDLKLAAAFEAKGLKGLYAVEKVELGHQAVAGYQKGAYNEKGEFVERDGVFTVKFVKYVLDDLTETYAIDTWIPSPEAYSESLTPATFWAPIHQEKKDEHGLAHDSDAVNLGGAGEYTYFLGVYKKAVGDSFFGIGVVQDKALDAYVPPVALSEYALPGQWNGWDNSATVAASAMTKVSDTEYKMEITAAKDDAGRVTKAGSWDTVANFTHVTVGADLVKDQGGDDHNFQFLAAGTYTVTLKLGGESPALEIVAK